MFSNKKFYTFVLLLCAFVNYTAISQSSHLETPTTAFETFRQGEELYIKGEYAPAAALFEKAAKAYGSNKEAQSMALTLFGLALVHSGKQDAAYIPLNHAESLYKEKQIKSPEAIATLKFGLGAYHWDHQEKKDTEILMQETEKLFQDKNPSVPISVGIEYYELLGKIAQGKGSYQKAIDHFSKAVENSEKLPVEKRHRENYANDKMVIGELYDKILDPSEAVQKYQNILEKKTEVIQDDVSKEIELNFRIGTSFFKQQQYEVAVAYLEKALDKIDATKINEIRKPSILAMLATIFTDQRKYELALENNSSALEFWKGGLGKDDLERLYKAYLNQGLIFQKIISKRSLLPWYKQSVDVSIANWEEALKLKKLDLVTNLITPAKTTDFNLALINYTLAKELITKFPQNQHLILNIELHMAHGALFFEAGAYSRAKFHYQTALDLMKTIYPEKHPLVAETSRMLGEIYLAEQLFDEALSFVDKALNATMLDGGEVASNALPDINKTKFPIELLNAISTKGVILFNKDGNSHSKENLTKVLHLYDLAIKLLHSLRKTYRNEGAKYRLASITHKFSQLAIKATDALYVLTKEEQYLNQAFRYAELSKSAVLLESIRDLKTRQITGVPDEIIKEENTLKVDINYFKSEVFYELRQGPNKNLTRLVGLEAQIKEKENAHESLLKKIEKEYPKYYNLKYNYNLKTITDLQKALKPNEVFLEYTTTDSFIYVLAIGKDKLFSHLTPLKTSLRSKIKSLQESITNLKPNEFADLGYSLYEQTLAPLQSFIEGKSLILCLDAELNYIPFDILPMNKITQGIKGDEVYKKITYLIEKHPICYSYSANLFLMNQFRSTKPAPLKIASWAPSFEHMNKMLAEKKIDIQLKPLAGAKQEVLNIASLFDTKALLGEEASEASFKKNAAQYSVLHIATHGLLEDNSPLFSSLAMTPTDGEDGLLHTYELYNLNLNADLIVLSACNSGIGEISKGEGVVSIARGFAYAGVPNIVMSTWAVSDLCTEEIMSDFYKNLKLGLSKDVALQQAKISFLAKHKNEGQVLAPFFWGGFILTGNNNPVAELIAPPTNYLLYIGIGVLALLIILLFLFLKKRSTN